MVLKKKHNIRFTLFEFITNLNVMCIEINIFYNGFYRHERKFLQLYEHNFQVELQQNNHVNQLNVTYGHKLHYKKIKLVMCFMFINNKISP
jgi:hypothetical protein